MKKALAGLVLAGLLAGCSPSKAESDAITDCLMMQYYVQQGDVQSGHSLLHTMAADADNPLRAPAAAFLLAVGEGDEAGANKALNELLSYCAIEPGPDSGEYG
jgi:hypothetical protein